MELRHHRANVSEAGRANRGPSGFTSALLVGAAPPPALERAFEFLEANGHFVFPMLALFVVASLAISVMKAWRAPELAGIQKAELKGEIIRFLRNRLVWTTAADVASHLSIDPHTAGGLMRELREDGLVHESSIEGTLCFRLKI